MSGKDQFGGKNTKFDTLVNQIMEAVTENADIWAIPETVISVGSPKLTKWNTRNAKAKTKTTATTVDRSNRNIARKSLSKWIRNFVQIWIYLNDNMTNADIISTGLKPHLLTKTKVGKPETTPLIYFQTGTGHNVKVFYLMPDDAEGGKKRGKPDGVAQMETAVFVAILLPATVEGKVVTVTVPSNPDGFGRFETATRNPQTLKFTDEQSGLIAYSASRWVTATGIRGDWSKVQSFRIP